MSDPYSSGIPPIPPDEPRAYPPQGLPDFRSPGFNGELTSSVKNTAMLAHLLGLVGYLGIPFGHLLGPFILWHTQKEKSPFIDFHGKESLNFQITVSIFALICLPFCLIFIGFLMLAVVGLYGFVLSIIAAIKASDGNYYRYPFTLRLIS